MNIPELKEAVNKSDMTTKSKAEIVEILFLWPDVQKALR